MTSIYLVVHNYRVDGWDGRERVEETVDTDQWFGSEDDAAGFLRKKGLPTYEEQVERMRAERDRVYRAALSKYKRDMRKVETAKRAGISPALLITPVEPVKPATPLPQEWHDIIDVTKHTDQKRN